MMKFCLFKTNWLLSAAFSAIRMDTSWRWNDPGTMVHLEREKCLYGDRPVM